MSDQAEAVRLANAAFDSRGDADKQWTLQELGEELVRLAKDVRLKGYRVMLSADRAIPPSPWTDRFRIEVDNRWGVIRLAGDLT